MENMEESEVMKLLRACLISVKGGIRIEDLNKDFRNLTELPGIPFRQLGYRSLEDFLRSTDAVRISQRNGQLIVEASSNEKTQHITNMVARQKTSKPKSKKKNSMRMPVQSSRFRSSSSTTSMLRQNRGGISNSTKSYSSCSSSNPIKPVQQRVIRSAPLPSQFNGILNHLRLPPNPPNIEHTNSRPSSLLPPPRQNEFRPPLLNLPIVPPIFDPRNVRPNPLISPLPLVPTNHGYTYFRPVPMAPPMQNGPLRPLMSVPIAPVRNQELPRYMNTNQQNSLPPPSKRLNQQPINQSVNNPVITHKTVHNEDKKPFETNPLTHTTRAPSKSSPLVLSPLSPGQLVKNENKWPSPTETMMTAKFNNGETANNVPIPPEKSPQERLKTLLAELTLPEPEYKVTEDIAKHKRSSSFYALIKIGTVKINTYPEESKTSEDAKNLAAQLAIQHCRQQHKSQDLKETEDKELVKKRVKDIVESHTSGIFVKQVVTDYEEKHREHLPNNWLSIINECTTIAVDRVANNQSILIKCNPAMKNSNAFKDESVTTTLERLNIEAVEPLTPKTLELPNQEFWFVHVYCVFDSTDVWGVLIGTDYNEKFELISAEMEKYYNSDLSLRNSKNIVIGQYYALKKPESWFRVKCISLDPDNKQVEVLFIDFGYQENCCPDEIYPLNKTFLDFPPQAIQLSIAGLEDFAKCSSVINTIETYLEDQSLCVEVLNLQEIEQDQIPNCVFYDTSGEADINLNFIIRKQILESLVPKLDGKVAVTEVFVCHVENNGDVFIQIQSESLSFFLELLNKLIQNGLTADELEKCVVKAIDTTQIYFVSFDDNWYRGKVMNINLQTNEVAVLLIDLGRTVNVTKQNLILLENLSPILAEYPQQAFKVRLHNIEHSMFLDEEFVKKLKEFAPYNESLLAKVVQQSSTSSNQPPVVELFKRHDPTHMLISINASLQHLDLPKLQGDGNNNNNSNNDNNNNSNNNNKRKRVERTLSKPTIITQNTSQPKALDPPKIPSVGQYFDIHVPMAANPGNFFVQPFDKDALGTMMKDLQQTCGSYKGPELTQDVLIPRQIYAGKHNDGHWYRVLLRHHIDANSVAVYFCDFGDISVISLDKLQPLHKKYFDLPYQAIKAKLVGIEPVDKDWSVHDTLRFQQLVVEKNFVSLIVESNVDESHEIVLGLRLIDTLTEQDIFIDKILVDEGRAITTVAK